MYGRDTAYSVVCYFISNSNKVLNKNEKESKKELQNLIKFYEYNQSNNKQISKNDKI